MPPHIIAVAALYVTAILHRDSDPRILDFIGTLNVDMFKVMESTQTILNLYSVWADYDDDQIPALLEQMELESRLKEIQGSKY
jgi:hypothetical protein